MTDFDPNQSFTIVMQSGDQYSSAVISGNEFNILTPKELNGIFLLLAERLVDDKEPTTHINHVRVFLEEQEKLHRAK